MSVVRSRRCGVVPKVETRCSEKTGGSGGLDEKG